MVDSFIVNWEVFVFPHLKFVVQHSNGRTLPRYLHKVRLSRGSHSNRPDLKHPSINGIMKILGHIRLRSRLKNTSNNISNDNPYQLPPTDLLRGQPKPQPKPHPCFRFSTFLFHELFSHVCPHSRDDSYLSCEESMIDGGCMLCDMKDLSQCALVNKQWSEAAQTLL